MLAIFVFVNIQMNIRYSTTGECTCGVHLVRFDTSGLEMRKVVVKMMFDHNKHDLGT
jgi:hypothetical protein